MTATSLDAARTQALLSEKFGFTAFRAGQAAVIAQLLAGHSALAVFPTGSGKSLCYQLPALLLEGLTVVVSPLIALMKDQVDFLLARGIAAARLDSSVSREVFEEIQSALRARSLKLLYVAPERFANERFLAQLKTLRIDLLVIDEAHCISEWGHNFRPDYLKLGKIRKQLGVKRLLALTATATPKVEADIRKRFGIAKADVVKLSFHRPNLDLRITPCQAAERKQLLLDRLAAHGSPAVVYVTRQETAEEVATFLSKHGLSARAYHAGLRSELRREIQEEFMGGAVDTVVATIAFGMGVDKADIRAVIHYNMPKSLEGYTQEIGRAGRDGLPAVCEWLACGDDRTTLENFIFSDTPSDRAVRNLLERVLKIGRDFDVSLYDLATTCDIRQTVVSTILAYLEMEGIIEARGSFFDRFGIKLLRPLERVLAGRPAKERKTLEAVFAELDAEWKWLRVEISATAERLGVSADSLRNLISDLEAAGDVALKKSNWRQAYSLKKEPESLRELAEAMAAGFREREASDLARLEKVLALSSTKNCLTGTLLRHFGEKMEQPCGHCDRCRGIVPTRLKVSKPRKITASELLEIRALADAKHASLGTPRQMARFLCGMSSPASMRARLYRHDGYGMLSDLPFGEVEVVAESLF